MTIGLASKDGESVNIAQNNTYAGKLGVSLAADYSVLDKLWWELLLWFLELKNVLLKYFEMHSDEEIALTWDPFLGVVKWTHCY